MIRVSAPPSETPGDALRSSRMLTAAEPEGPGRRRTTIWVQGCTALSIAEWIPRALDDAAEAGVEGITLLGRKLDA
ncbi:hypothetical protein [Nocardia sp. IFM 10818]